MKNIISLSFISCLFFISCISYKSATIKNYSQLKVIWKDKIQQTDEKRIEEIIKMKYLNYSNLKFSSDSAFYYISDNDNILASISYLAEPSTLSFMQRYNETKGLLNNVEFGNKLLSSDYKVDGNDWIYAIEYTDMKTPNKYLYFFIEASLDGKFVKGHIISDPSHREDAINLVNYFSKTLTNTKLHL